MITKRETISGLEMISLWHDDNIIITPLILLVQIVIVYFMNR